MGEGEVQAATSGKCGENVTWELSEEGVLTIKGSGPMYHRNYDPNGDMSSEELRIVTFHSHGDSGEANAVPEAGWDSELVKEVRVEDGVTNVGEYVFAKHTSLTKVTLQDSVVEIENGAFFMSQKLADLSLSNTLTTIGNQAFFYCRHLENVVLPSSLTTIGGDAFAYNGFEEIVIPENVTQIQEVTFRNCYSLKSIKLPERLESIGMGAFYECTKLESIEIPDSVVDMAGMVFYSCESLESIHLPERLIEIDNEAFEWTALREVVIPDSVKMIHPSAFRGCENLENVTIGSGVKKIDENAFSGCIRLKTLTFKGAAPVILDKIFTKRSEAIFVYESVDSVDPRPTLESVTAIYPRYDESWTEEVMSHDYGVPVNWELAPLTELRTPVVKLSNTNEGIRVNWEAVQYAESYEISRKMENGEFVKVATVGADARTYSDKDVLNGKAYTYAVTAHSGEITSEAGQQKLMFLNNPGTTLANTNKGVKVSWNRVPSAKGYEVYRKLSSDKTYTKIATIKKGSTTSYVDAGTKSGKVYVYAVKAFYNSKHKSAHTRQSIRSLGTPSITKAVRGKTGVSLRWTAVSGAKGYYVYRKAGNGKYVRIATRDKVGSVTFKDTKAKAGQTYTYAVRAFNGKSMSAFVGKTVK